MDTRSNAGGRLPRSVPLLTVLFVMTMLTSSSAQTGEKKGSPSPPAQAPSSPQGWKGDPYLLSTDPVTGEPLGPIEKQTKLQHEGREFRFASPQNAETFKASPQKYVAAVDERVVADQMTFYPLDTCLVSGEKLGPGARNLVHKNRLVRLSSPEHEATFLKDPAKYVAQLDKAVIEKQKAGYVAKTCPVSKEPLGGEMGDPVDYVVGNRLVRLCCKSCGKDLDKDPLKYLRFPDRENKTEAGPSDPR